MEPSFKKKAAICNNCCITISKFYLFNILIKCKTCKGAAAVYRG